MLIANPIYDVVFKYLLEDNKIAKLFLGAIIGEKIDKLDFRPQEYSVTLEKKKSKKLRNLRDKLVQKAIPIVPIYFLGHRLDLEEGHPIVKIARQYVDNTTGELIKGKDNFIEGLTHDSFVIQIQDLPTRRRNELEKLLSIFDQTNHTQDYHILNVNEADEDQLKIIEELRQQLNKK